jgi:uncharacterized membrane protein YdbT with pleckstrin-like domain
MWNINQKYLQKDETIEYTGRPSKLSCIFSYIWVGLMALTSTCMFIASMDIKDPGFRSFTLVYIIFALPGIYMILKRFSTCFAISNKGLLTRNGIVTTSIKTVPFKHITSIEVKESLIGKIFRYAHLSIDTSGSGKGVELRWDYVVMAHKVKKLIEKHIQ